MSETELDLPVRSWLTQAEVARRLGVTPGHVRQLLRARELVGVRRGPGGAVEIPADLLDGDRVLKGLPGCLTLLHDAGYDAAESIRWLATVDDALGEPPLAALHARRHKVVHRRAQLLGF